MIPQLIVIRPADGNETSGAYKIAVEKAKASHPQPTLLALSRQGLPNLAGSSIDATMDGTYGPVWSRGQGARG